MIIIIHIIIIHIIIIITIIMIIIIVVVVVDKLTTGHVMGDDHCMLPMALVGSVERKGLVSQRSLQAPFHLLFYYYSY